MLKKLFIVSLLGGLILLYLINPEHSAYLPKCPFYMLTGFECPACGTQRAIHQLLHFHFKEAFRYNPFLLVSLSYLTAFVWTEWFDSRRRFPRFHTFCRHRYVLYTYLTLIMLWWIGRNVIPFFPLF